MSESQVNNRQLASPGQRYDARLRSRTSSTTLQARLIEHEKRNLEQALSVVTEDGSVVRSAALIVASRRRFVAGAGKSFAYANLLSSDLSEGLSNVNLIADSVLRQVDVLADVRETDVLVVFSFRRYRKDMVSLARQFAKQGGAIVAITDHADSPIAVTANEVVVVATDSVSFADSPTAVSAVIHVLSTLATASAKGARRRLTERDRHSHELGLYWEDAS